MSFDFHDLIASIVKFAGISTAFRDLVENLTPSTDSSTYNASHADTPNPAADRLLQPIWDLRLGWEDYVASPLFPVFLSVSFYFTLCTPFMIADLWGRKWSWVRKYKIQSTLEVTPAQVMDTLNVTFWNHVLYILPAAVSQWVWTPDTPLPDPAPTVLEFVGHQLAGLLIFDLQYFVWHTTHHRVRFLYRRVHALHHRYHAPFCWVTQYLHPWELVTVGFLTTTNMWFFEAHPLTVWSYMMVSILISVEAHIGFDFPFALNNLLPLDLVGGAPKHDMHHLKPLTNFEPFFNHWDKLMGTWCPVMKAGGVKPEALLDYERRQRETRKVR